MSNSELELRAQSSELLPAQCSMLALNCFMGQQNDDGLTRCACQIHAMSDFRKLLVSQKAHALSLETAKFVRLFARKSRRLADQISRAADAIPALIAEGRGSSTDKDFARYLTMGIKEANELESHLQRAVDGKLCPQREHSAITANTVEVRRMLIGLRKRLVLQPESTEH